MLVPTGLSVIRVAVESAYACALAILFITGPGPFFFAVARSAVGASDRIRISCDSQTVAMPQDQHGRQEEHTVWCFTKIVPAVQERALSGLALRRIADRGVEAFGCVGPEGSATSRASVARCHILEGLLISVFSGGALFALFTCWRFRCVLVRFEITEVISVFAKAVIRSRCCGDRGGKGNEVTETKVIIVWFDVKAPSHPEVRRLRIR